MKTKEILTENRDSVISSIKYVFQVWKAEDIKLKMIQFLAFAETCDIDSGSKKIKSDLKTLIQKMAISQKQPTDSRKWYEIAEDIANSKGLYRDSLTGKMYKL